MPHRDERRTQSNACCSQRYCRHFCSSNFKGKTTRLSKLAARNRDAVRQKDITSYVQSDIEFHRAILEAAGNKVLLRSWDALDLR
ncbi:MAG: FCD domain-containing protein [Bryobacteraceae bacterium]